jgi:hypothetical protein
MGFIPLCGAGLKEVSPAKLGSSSPETETPQPTAPMAAKTHQPYQKIVLVPRGDAIESSFLLAASGSTLTSISLRQGSIVSQWPEAPAIANEAGRLASRSTQTNNEIQGEKAEQDQEQAQEPEPDQKQDAGKKEPEPSLKRKRGNEPAPAGPPSISHVALAPSGEHVVVATLQDKTLRVLSLSAEGILTHLTAGSALPPLLSRDCTLTRSPQSDAQAALGPGVHAFRRHGPRR